MLLTATKKDRAEQPHPRSPRLLVENRNLQAKKPRHGICIRCEI